MVGSYSILVGTTGAGLFQSPDGGENWSRIRDPFPGESQVRALASDPQKPNVVYAGSNNGIYRSEDAGNSWVFGDRRWGSLVPKWAPWLERANHFPLKP